MPKHYKIWWGVQNAVPKPLPSSTESWGFTAAVHIHGRRMHTRALIGLTTGVQIVVIGWCTRISQP